MKMALVLLLVMLTACAATPQDLSGKMFTFPQETNTAHVRLTTSKQDLSAVTVCFRFSTDLPRDYSLFSLAIPSFDNEFIIYKKGGGPMQMNVKGKVAGFAGLEYSLNEWHSICATWESASGIGQLWLDGKPTSRKFISSGANITGNIIMVLGQEQDTHGGGFDIKQSFVGMMSDVHMWDQVLSSCDIETYAKELSFTPGNVLNWGSLDFQIVNRVLIENKQKGCQ